MTKLTWMACAALLAGALAGCATNSGRPQAETGLGREAGYAVGSEIGGQHAYLGGHLGSILGGGAERAAHAQAAKPASTQPADANP